MRISLILLLILSLTTGCSVPAMPPTDHEMIQHFNNKYLAFEKIYEIISSCPDNSYYPPYYAEDTLCLNGISPVIQKKLDSLLSEIQCERIYYKRQSGQDNDILGMMELSISFYSDGYSVGGTAKDFVYCAPTIRDYYKMSDNMELNDIIRENYNDTILYKPIIDNWYIRLIHDR